MGTATSRGTMPFEKLVVIDARNHLLGRLASFVAKEALLGQKVVLVRCEDMVISGSFIRNKMKLLMKRNKRMNTNPVKGPFHHRSPPDMVMRVIRGMLPHKHYRGSAAFQRIKCVEGIPEPFASLKRVVVPNAFRVTRFRRWENSRWILAGATRMCLLNMRRSARERPQPITQKARPRKLPLQRQRLPISETCSLYVTAS